jgi:chemotaxis protein MotB
MSVDGVRIVRHEDAVTLQIAEVVLFDSSRAMLKPTAAPVLERAIMLLNEFGEVAVAVQGHTDNQPVRGGEYRSNWELASARANAVAAHLLQQGFPPERLRVESYADTRPVAENDTSTGRARNRRVELRVALPLAAETIALR